MVAYDKRTVRVAALAALLVVPLALLATGGESPPGAGPSDDLWAAIVQVESGGNARAYNQHDGAAGIAQIRPVCLRDVNRIARQGGLSQRFDPADCGSPAASRRMWDLYLTYYGAQYEKQTGRPATDEVYARLWNGGPDGWRKSSTLKYWRRVRAVLEAARSESARAAPGRDAIQIAAGNPPAAPFHLPSPFPPTAPLVLPAEAEDRAAGPAVGPDAERFAAADAEGPA